MDFVDQAWFQALGLIGATMGFMVSIEDGSWLKVGLFTGVGASIYVSLVS